MTDHSAPPGSDPVPSPRLRELELEVAREIAESFLTATSPLEVYRLALARVTPLVGASFASVFLRDDHDPRLLRLACAQSWPQASARFLSELRIREGRGPTGRAVGLGRPVEVVDVFGDPELEAWWEPARELGFVSMMALPLAVEGRVFGALSFYFQDRQEFEDEARELLGVVAHQLATTAERAQLMAQLHASNLRLERENAALMRQIREAEEILGRGGPAPGSRPEEPPSPGEAPDPAPPPDPGAEDLSGPSGAPGGGSR